VGWAVDLKEKKKRKEKKKNEDPQDQTGYRRSD